MNKHTALALLLLSGCVADRFANPAACDTTHPCAEGDCVDGFCVVGGGMDAGMRDGGIDGGCTPCSASDGGNPEIGVCRPGCAVPNPAGGTMCVDEVLPTDETCNGFDDDCDGSTDEDFALDTMTACGTCTAACTGGEECCETADPPTPADHVCANLSSDHEHCGVCGNPCGVRQACCDSACVDIDTDGNNCGSCGNMCTGGRTCCGGECIDTRFSTTHCGGCQGDGGTTCTGTDVCCPPTGGGPSGCRASSMCAACSPACGAGMQCCNPPTGCVNVMGNDANNCGACGAQCGSNQRCCGGSCVALENNCASCGNDCAAMSAHCCGGACVPATNMNHCGGCGNVCPTDTTCCGDGVRCVDLDIDPAHCGMCTRQCVGEACSDGNCCPLGRIWCSGQGCVDPNSETNCGRCNVACGGPTCNCTAGSCTGVCL